MGQKDGNAEVHDASSADYKSCMGTQVEAGLAETEMDISQGTTLVMGGEVEKDSETASSCQQEIDDDDSMTQDDHECALKIYKAGFVVGAFYVKHYLSIEGGTAPSEDDIAGMAETSGNRDIAKLAGREVEKDSETASSCQQEIDDDDSMTRDEHECALKIYKTGFVVGAFYPKYRLSIEGGTAPSEVEIARMAEMRGNIDIALMFLGHDPTCQQMSEKA